MNELSQFTMESMSSRDVGQVGSPPGAACPEEVSVRFRGQTCAFQAIHSDSCLNIDSSKAGRNQSLNDVLSITSEVQTSDACEQRS